MVAEIRSSGESGEDSKREEEEDDEEEEEVEGEDGRRGKESESWINDERVEESIKVKTLHITMSLTASSRR